MYAESHTCTTQGDQTGQVGETSFGIFQMLATGVGGVVDMCPRGQAGVRASMGRKLGAEDSYIQKKHSHL